MAIVIDPHLQRYYEDRETMCGSVPWKQLMEDIQEMVASTNNVSAISDEKMLNFRKGELSMMRWMLSIKEVSEAAYQQLKDENDENT